MDNEEVVYNDIINMNRKIAINQGRTGNELHWLNSSSIFMVRRAKELIEKGCDVNAKDYEGFTPLQRIAMDIYYYSIQSANHAIILKIANMLIDAGADIHSLDIIESKDDSISKMVKDIRASRVNKDATKSADTKDTGDKCPFKWEY